MVDIENCAVCGTCGKKTNGEDIVSDLRETIIDLLMSADATWEANKEGHDWVQAVEAARAAVRRSASWLGLYGIEDKRNG